MKRNINNSNITKDFIFSKISQLTIFSVYTGIDVAIIQDCIDNGTLIQSPFRIDNHPSFGFKYSPGGKLKGRDFAGYFWGDCLDAAAYTLSGINNCNININKKNDFNYVIKHITYVFRDIIYGKAKDENITNSITYGLDNIRNKKNIIELVTRPWNDLDSKYWKQFGISLNHLNTHFVYAIDQYYINRYSNPLPKYYYNSKDLCYAYILGQDSNGVYNIKLYFPNRKKGDIRFITNSNHIEGVLNFERNDYDYIIITKSTKDRLSIESHFISCNPLRGIRTTNIGVINIPHETYHLKQNEYDFIKSKLKSNGIIISFMDNDKAGYREAIWLRDNYNIPPIFIPKDYEVKDFSELKSSYSNELINDLIIETFNYIEQNYRNNDENNKFTWGKEESSIIPF